jgi:hypothetical protein
VLEQKHHTVLSLRNNFGKVASPSITRILMWVTCCLHFNLCKSAGVKIPKLSAVNAMKNNGPSLCLDLPVFIFGFLNVRKWVERWRPDTNDRMADRTKAF